MQGQCPSVSVIVIASLSTPVSCMHIPRDLCFPAKRIHTAAAVAATPAACIATAACCYYAYNLLVLPATIAPPPAFAIAALPLIATPAALLLTLWLCIKHKNTNTEEYRIAGNFRRV